MPWVRASLRGQRIYARAKADGALDEQGGKVEIRYKPSDGRRYDAMAKNLGEVSTELLPDDTCAEAKKPEPKAEGAAPAKATGPAKRGGALRERRDHAPQLVAPADGHVVAYTDGACTGNPGPAGLGAVVVVGGQRTELSEFLGHSTNNVAELTAVLRAVELAPADSPLYVHTDSQYAIGVLSRGWKAKANVELVATIREALKKRGGVELVYVPGHSGFAMNELADELARNAIKARKTAKRTVDAPEPA